MPDVAIIGVGLHPFGRFPGKSAIEMGADAAKNYRNGSLNPSAFRRKPLDEDEILRSRMVNDPLTQYMFCSPDEGAAAVIICRADMVHRFTSRPLYLLASEVRTRRFGTFEVHTPSFPPAERAPAPTVDVSVAAYEKAGVGPRDVDVVQLQDTDAGAEVYAQLYGAPGTAGVSIIST
jgi:acetyl-CoA C-acetyltransferase